MTEHKRPFRQSFASAVRGIWYAARREKHIRVHYIIGGLALAFGLVIGLHEPLDWAILVVMIAVVIVAEMINTAIEIIVSTVVR
ncbi:MAG: diacylglycerol kinase, partial [Planctomycetota bacterium]